MQGACSREGAEAGCRRPGTRGSHLCHPYPPRAQRCHSHWHHMCWRGEPSPAVPWLQRGPGPRDSGTVSCEHLQPLGTHPSCQGSSCCTVTPGMLLAGLAAPYLFPPCFPGGKQERGHGAPASLQAGPAGSCVGAVSALPGWRSCCPCALSALQVVVVPLCHTPGAQAGFGV